MTMRSMGMKMMVMPRHGFIRNGIDLTSMYVIN